MTLFGAILCLSCRYFDLFEAQLMNQYGGSVDQNGLSGVDVSLYPWFNLSMRN